MSSFITLCKNRKTNELLEVICIDDYFGKHQYGFNVAETTGYLNEDQFFRDYFIIEKQHRKDEKS